MFSGLYGDLPQAKDESERKQQPESSAAAATAAPPGSWSGSTLLVPTTKRPAATSAMPPPSVMLRANKHRADSLATDASIDKNKSSTQAAETADQSNATAFAAAASTPATASASFWGSNIIEEYDPNRPNDYDAICRRKEQLRLEAVAEAERQERLREIKELEELGNLREQEEKGMELLGVSNQEQGFGMGIGGGFNGGGGGLGLGATGGVAHEASAVAAAGGPKGMTLAQQMLEKMGWKHGEGLGKSGQGIAAPLAVQKTDARSGRVVALEPLPPTAGAGLWTPAALSDQPPPQLFQNEDLEIAGKPSNVIVLRNVVPPGAVDESLDEEIGLECSKYGEVTSVLIFEVTESNFPEEEAVRVYVQFEHQQAAAAALAELHGRLFGGRRVLGKYFNENRFESGDLAPRIGEDM